MGRVPWEETVPVMSDHANICRTDYCDTEGNYNRLEH